MFVQLCLTISSNIMIDIFKVYTCHSVLSYFVFILLFRAESVVVLHTQQVTCEIHNKSTLANKP